MTWMNSYTTKWYVATLSMPEWYNFTNNGHDNLHIRMRPTNIMYHHELAQHWFGWCHYKGLLSHGMFFIRYWGVINSLNFRKWKLYTHIILISNLAIVFIYHLRLHLSFHIGNEIRYFGRLYFLSNTLRFLPIGRDGSHMAQKHWGSSGKSESVLGKQMRSNMTSVIS